MSNVTTKTKVIASSVLLALLIGISTVSCGPMLAILATMPANDCGNDWLSPDGDPPIPSGDPDARLNLRIATWNVYRANTVNQVAAGLRELAQHSDVIGLQEFRPKFRSRTITDALPGWSWSGQETAVPILWNTAKLSIATVSTAASRSTEAKGKVLEFDTTRLTAGPVGTSAGPKWLEWVQLRDRRTGASVAVINHHLLYHIESKGHPNKQSGARYLALAQKQIRTELQLVDRFKATGIPVAVTKDANWAAVESARTKDPASPYIQAGRHGLYTSWQVLRYPGRGTHKDSGRLIDSVATTTATLIPTNQQILGRPAERPFHGSDHAPVVVTATNTASSINAAARRATANKALITTSRAGTTGVAAVGGLTQTQMTVAQTIYTTTLAVGRERGWPGPQTDKAFLIAVATARKESTLGADPRSKSPDRNGDGGTFAQRTKPGWYGTIDQVNDPAYGTRTFLLGKRVTAAGVAAAHRAGVQPAGPAGYTIPGLVQINGWASMSVSEASHRIQRSAFPQMPPAFEALAKALLTAFRKAGLSATSSDVDTDLSQQCATGAGTTDPAIGSTTGCPLDSQFAPGQGNPHTCDEALDFLAHQAEIGSRRWYRSCLALVAQAYGWGWSGVGTAGQHAALLQRAGQLHTSRTNIPRGAVLWWTNSGAGHTAIYDGNGYIWSNDITTPGTVSRIRWDYPETNWHQHFAGWSAPYFPHGGGSD